MLPPAQRTQLIAPFYAVEVFKQAQQLAAQGRDIVSLGIGEPDFTAPEPVAQALVRAVQDGLGQYTLPTGLSALRVAIAQHYQQRYGATVDPACVVITAGASGALMLATAAVINPGDEILMPDPSYPANRAFILATGGRPVLLPTEASNGFHLTPDDIAQHWGPQTRGVLLASPGNPTGTSIAPEALRALVAAVRARGGYVIMDEIYLGLSYDQAPRSVLALDEPGLADHVIVINSFSKYFHMTGWRLGWMIVPPALLDAVDRLSANLAICAPSLAQHAALACFEPEALAIYEDRRRTFQARRDYLLPNLQALGLPVPATPDGAFYIYVDVGHLGLDSGAFCQRLLHEAGVAVVPGHDFGPARGHRAIRLSYATSLEQLEQAVERLGRFLPTLAG